LRLLQVTPDQMAVNHSVAVIPVVTGKRGDS